MPGDLEGVNEARPAVSRGRADGHRGSPGCRDAVFFELLSLHKLIDLADHKVSGADQALRALAQASETALADQGDRGVNPRGEWGRCDACAVPVAVPGGRKYC
jgi:hypothetical protein